VDGGCTPPHRVAPRRAQDRRRPRGDARDAPLVSVDCVLRSPLCRGARQTEWGGFESATETSGRVGATVAACARGGQRPLAGTFEAGVTEEQYRDETSAWPRTPMVPPPRVPPLWVARPTRVAPAPPARSPSWWPSRDRGGEGKKRQAGTRHRCAIAPARVGRPSTVPAGAGVGRARRRPWPRRVAMGRPRPEGDGRRPGLLRSRWRLHVGHVRAPTGGRRSAASVPPARRHGVPSPSQDESRQRQTTDNASC